MNQTTTGVSALIEEAVAAHRDERGPLLVILHEIHETLGFIPSDAVPVLAKKLNISRADVHGVISFYKDFRTEPAGRVRVALCRAEACQATGAERVVHDVETSLGITVGQTSPDGQVTLDHVFCVGNCALGPSAQVNGQIHGRVDANRITALIAGALQ